jgi:hypothetical protein
MISVERNDLEARIVCWCGLVSGVTCVALSAIAMSRLTLDDLSVHPLCQSGLPYQSGPSTCPMEQDRSQTPGYPFLAHAEIVVENSDVCLTARVCELSRQGCHLYAVNPPPVGASVLVKVYAWPNFFQARATVYHSDPKLGVGVAFNEIEPHHVSVLDACLLEAEQKQRNRH